MIRLIAGLLAWIACAALASAASPNASYGTHGMALFGGKDGLYVSHLPMFHAPHDVQLVAKVRLADAAQDAALRAQLESKLTLWTVSPEKFELDRLAPGAANPLREFRADLVLGHFEQGGATQQAGITVLVERVLAYRKLSPAMSTAARARYFQVGQGAQRFLVKEIDSRPDFDHIVAIAASSARPDQLASVPRRALEQPADAALEAALPSAKVRATIYYYTDDLR